MVDDVNVDDSDDNRNASRPRVEIVGATVSYLMDSKVPVTYSYEILGIAIDVVGMVVVTGIAVVVRCRIVVPLHVGIGSFRYYSPQ